MTDYVTLDGDVLDDVALRMLGSAAQVVRLIEANPHIADGPAVLPAGIVISLPAPVPVAAVPTIRLWGKAR